MALPDQGMFDLGGKVVLVTGAAQGLGKAVAEACAQQGAVVIIVDVEDQLAQQVASEIQQATGQSVTAHCCDVRCTDQVQELVATVITQHDRIDVLVNVAGAEGAHGAWRALPATRDWAQPRRQGEPRQLGRSGGGERVGSAAATRESEQPLAQGGA